MSKSYLDIAHSFKKLPSTIKICYTLFMARTFGSYIVTYHDDFTYALYEWKGKYWAIPTADWEDYLTCNK